MKITNWWLNEDGTPKKECDICSEIHTWNDCPYYEETCKHCGNFWHLSQHHLNRTTDCLQQPAGKCDFCKDEDAKESKTGEMAKKLAKEDNKKWGDYCPLMWKMKVDIGEKNKAKNNKVRQITNTTTGEKDNQILKYAVISTIAITALFLIYYFIYKKPSPENRIRTEID